MDFKEKYLITPKYLTSGSKRRSGLFVSPGVKFIVAHDTGNPDSTASGNVRYYENTCNETSASAHLFVDDKEIIECIPALTGQPEKAWHVLYNVPTDNAMFGHNANDAAIGVEYCYGDRIDADEAYRKFIWSIAKACFIFNLDPNISVVGHFFLDPKRKTDPIAGLARSRRTYEQLLNDIVSEFNECTATEQPKPLAFTAQSGIVKSNVKLNIRKGEPNTKIDVVQVVPPGIQLHYIGWVDNGENINNNAKWYKDVNGNYFWAGGVVS